MSIKITLMNKHDNSPIENLRRIKLLYYVNGEPYGLVMKSMFTTSKYSINQHNVVMSTSDASECALVCLMNNLCEHFEFRKKLSNNGICMLSYAILENAKSKCQSECYEIRKGTYESMNILRLLLIKKNLERPNPVDIKLAPYHNYRFEVSFQDNNLSWSRYEKSKDISCM
jgi:hypothetical protein